MARPKPDPIKCEHCGAEFVPAKPSRRFCSKRCSNSSRIYGITSYPGLYNRLQKLYPEPQPCVECGAPGQHRHHPDYDKPLEIVWMCAPCHRRVHQLGKHGKGGGRQRPGVGNTLPILP